MQLLLVVSCLFAFTYAVSEDYQNKAMAIVAEIADKCVKETGASEDDIAQLMDKKTPTRKEGKCLVACFYKQIGLMKDGKVDKAGSMEMLQPLKEDDPTAYSKAVSVMNKVQEEMAAVDEKDECEYAMKVSECTTKVAKELNVNLEDFML